ncbi:hypothetical protein KP509_21G031800 [Ceratopteris richardii]|nr:hypothetical protein KP509_21G031800 [Ceratopteris richardii]
MRVSTSQSQGLGEHNFLGQANQVCHSKLDNGEHYIQSQNLASGGLNMDNLRAHNLPMDNTLGSRNGGMPGRNAEASLTYANIASAAAGTFFEGRQSTSNREQYTGNLQNELSKSSNFPPMNSGMLEHQSSADEVNTSSHSHQNQNYNYGHQNPVPTGVKVNPNRAFISQLPIGTVRAQSEGGQGGVTRSFGMTELQLLRQQALKSRQQQALQFKQQQAMRMQQQEALYKQQQAARIQQQEVLRVQQEEATRKQQTAMMMQQEAWRMQQQQEVRRLQRQVAMPQQEGISRMQQGLYLQQQGAVRKEGQSLAGFSPQEQGAIQSKQPGMMPYQQQVLLSGQQKTAWCQQGEHMKDLQPRQQWGWQSQQQKSILPMQQQVWSSNQPQVLQSQQGQASEFQQLQFMQKQHQLLSHQEQEPVGPQNQLQVSQSQNKHYLPLQYGGVQPQQDMSQARAKRSEVDAEFPGTYSALLHGPDTPPHSQSGGETLYSDLGNSNTGFPPACNRNPGWSTNESSLIQGLSTQALMSQSTAESQNFRSALFSAEANSFTLAEGQRRQSSLEGYPDNGSRTASLSKPSFQSNVSVAESGAADFGFIGDYNMDPKVAHQVAGNTTIQGSYSMPRQIAQFNSLSSVPIQAQHHSQGVNMNQQRSWESLEQKHLLSKSSASENHPKSMPSFRSHHGLHNYGVRQASPSHEAQLPGNTHSITDTIHKQQQMLKFTVGETALINVADKEVRQGSESSSTSKSFQVAQISSDAKNSNLESRWPLHSSQIVQTPVHSGSPSESSSQAILNAYQRNVSDSQLPLSMRTATNSFCGQEGSVWGENNKIGQTSSYFSYPESHSQILLKQHASFQESQDGLENRREESVRGLDGSAWKHGCQIDTSTTDPQRDIQATSTLSKSFTGQDSGQEIDQQQFSMSEALFQQSQKDCGVNRIDNQDIAVSLEAANQDVAAGNNELRTAVDKHGVIGPSVDSSSNRVSLAHLRQSQSSSPLSLQHVRLGLAPANVSRNLQQILNMNTWTSSQGDGIYQKDYGSNTNMQGNKFLNGMSQGISGYEHVVENRNECNQNAWHFNGNMQSNAKLGSAPSNSPSIGKETADSEVVPFTGFVHGAEASGVSQRALLKVDSIYGIGTNSGRSGAESSLAVDGSADFSGQLSHVADDNHDTLSTRPGCSNMEGGSLVTLKNQQILNMALEQLGNRRQAENFAEFCTAMKTSLLEHSNNVNEQEKMIPVAAESNRHLFNTAQEYGNAVQTTQSPQIILNHPVHLGGKLLEDCPPVISGTLGISGDLNLSSSYNQEGHGLTNLKLLAEMHRRSRQSLPINASDSASPSGEQVSVFPVLKTLDSVSSLVECQATGSMTQPAALSKEKYLQHAGPVSELAIAASSNATLPNAIGAVDVANDSQLEPFKNSSIFGRPGNVHMRKQGNTLFEEQNMRPINGLKEFQRHKFSGSEGPLSTLGQVPKQTSKNVMDANSFQYVDKAVEFVSANKTELLHQVRLQANSNNSWAQHVQDSRQEDHSALGKPENRLSANNNSQPASDIRSNQHVSTVKEGAGTKFEDAQPGVKDHLSVFNKLSQRQLLSSKPSLISPSALHPKKRKKPIPLLIPWYIAATQPRDSLPSASDMEKIWANTANRLIDKDDVDVHKDNLSSTIKGKRRLKLTNQLMQQLIPPVPGEMMHGHTPVDNECATFTLAKFTLEDACRLVTNSRKEANSASNYSENKNMLLHGQTGRSSAASSIAVTRCEETFMERARGLENELARIENLSCVSDLRQEIEDLEHMAIGSRLAEHHGTNSLIDSCEASAVERYDTGGGISKSSPNKYVTAIPMPRTLPGVKCLSL